MPNLLDSMKQALEARQAAQRPENVGSRPETQGRGPAPTKNRNNRPEKRTAQRGR